MGKIAARWVSRTAATSASTETVDDIITPITWDWQYRFNDSATAKLSYTQKQGFAGSSGGPVPDIFIQSAPNGNSISSFGLQLMFNNSGIWVTPPHADFYPVKWTLDPKDTRGVVEVEMVGVDSFDLTGIYFMSLVGVPAGTYSRVFATGNGGILAPMLDQAQDGLIAKMLTRSFTSTAQTGGGTWSASAANLPVPLTTSMWALLQQMVDAGWVDYKIEGNRLDIYNAGSTAIQRNLATIAEPVALLDGREVGSTSVVVDYTEISRSTLVVDQSRSSIFASTGAGATRRGSRVTLATKYFEGWDTTNAAAHGLPGVEYTKDLDIASSTFLPINNYRPGDLVLANNHLNNGTSTQPTTQAMRLRQLTLSQDSDGAIGGSVVLGDLASDRAERLARRLNGLTV